ncbi:hypothetical protein G6F56_012754 [Rhizopus delemar]|nr:hypothetical protein G6F56_012754 [Rhizopus delemar]
MSNPPDEFLNKVKQVEKLIKNFEASECTEDMKRHQTTVDQTCDKYFKEQMETIQKLEKDLELLKIMESKSVQDYNDSINQHKACIEDENTLEICLEKQGDNFDQLNREIELLEEQIHKLDDDYTDDFNPYE